MSARPLVFVRCPRCRRELPVPARYTRLEAQLEHGPTCTGPADPQAMVQVQRVLERFIAGVDSKALRN